MHTRYFVKFSVRVLSESSRIFSRLILESATGNLNTRVLCTALMKSNKNKTVNSDMINCVCLYYGKFCKNVTTVPILRTNQQLCNKKFIYF